MSIFDKYKPLIDSLKKEGDKDKLKELFRELGRRGGESTYKKHGSKHFSRAGKIGSKKRWETEKHK